MSASSTTLRHDGLALRRESGTWVLLGVMVAAALVAISAGHREYARLQRTQQQVQDQVQTARADAAELATRLLSGGGDVPRWRDPRIADVVGRRLVIEQAVLPPTPLMPLATGQIGLLATQQPVSLDAREELLSEGELTPPRRLATGPLDMSFVVVFLAPLLVIVLGHGVVAWERQHGLLRLLLLQRSSLTGWLIGRHALRLAVVAVPLLVAGLSVTLAGGADGTALARFAGWSLVVVLYLGFWSVLVAAVAARARGADQSLLALAACWMLLVVVLPSAINTAVEMVFPVPQRILYVDQLRDATDEAKAEGSRMLANFLEDHPEMASRPVDPQDYHAQRFVVQQQVEAAMAPLADEFRRRRDARHHSLQWLRFLSPAILAAEGLEEAAGTGEGRYRHFHQQVDAFHTEWRAFFEPHVLSREPFSAHAQIPHFGYHEESTGQVAGRLLPLLLGLGLMGALAGLAARRCVRDLH